MKLPALFLLLVLSLLTSSAYAPVLGPGLLVADPAMIFLAWVCLGDRWPRIVAVAIGLAIYRLSGTVASLLEVIAPLLALIVTVRLICMGISPFDRWRRLGIVTLALLAAGILGQWLVASHLGRGIQGFFADGLLALIVAAVMFPLLDLTRPMLKSARYPQ